MMKEKILSTWSGGKTGSLALYELQRRARYQVAALVVFLPSCRTDAADWAEKARAVRIAI